MKKTGEIFLYYKSVIIKLLKCNYYSFIMYRKKYIIKLVVCNDFLWGVWYNVNYKVGINNINFKIIYNIDLDNAFITIYKNYYYILW